MTTPSHAHLKAGWQYSELVGSIGGWIIERPDEGYDLIVMREKKRSRTWWAYVVRRTDAATLSATEWPTRENAMNAAMQWKPIYRIAILKNQTFQGAVYFDEALFEVSAEYAKHLVETGVARPAPVTDGERVMWEALMPLPTEITYRGETYYLSDTGGGCSAYERRDEDRKETWLITRDAGACAPYAGEDAYLGCWPDEGDAPSNDMGELIPNWRPDADSYGSVEDATACEDHPSALPAPAEKETAK